MLQEGHSKRKGSPQGEQKFSASWQIHPAGLQVGELERRVRRWQGCALGAGKAVPWHQGPGTRALSPEPRACQSWQQVLGRIRKPPSVFAPQPGSGLHFIPNAISR